jgi:hypothetical protein
MNDLPKDATLFGRQHAGEWDLRFVRGASVLATGTGKTLRDAFGALAKDWRASLC